MRKSFLALIIWLFTPQGTAQWSTSTYAESALWIGTGGFNATAVTFDDGSVIICSGPWSTINLLKLDPNGYRVWPECVTAHHNDSTDTEGGVGIGSMVTDGAGGVIFLWGDHRGAFQDSVEGKYYNNALYIQRVDSNGTVRWQAGGVLVAPAQTGEKKQFGLCTDGAGGVVAAWSEYGFGYPDSPGEVNLKAARYNASGVKLWEVLLDSVHRSYRPIGFETIARAGKYVYIDYVKWPPVGAETYITRIIDTSGASPPDSLWYGYYANRVWKDSILFSLSYPEPGVRLLRKIGSNGTTVGTASYSQTFGCGSPAQIMNTGLIPDGRGGIYHIRQCGDSVLHFSSYFDTVDQVVFPGIDHIGGYLFADRYGGIVLANGSGKAQRYDSLGNPLWGASPITYLTDPENMYGPQFFSDKNGGIIVTYWSWGIYAAHTGRYGRVGVVPVMESPELPTRTELYQNYPNPFNPFTIFGFRLPIASYVTLTIYDVLGREVATLVDEVKRPGEYTVRWSARNLPSGVYFYRLQSGSFTQTRKLILMR